MTGLREACQLFTAEARASPFSTWLIVENEDIRRHVFKHITTPVLADRITTPKSLAQTILQEQRIPIRIIPPEEQFLLFSRFADEVFDSATKTLTENLIDLYITLIINKAACPTDTQKGKNAAAVFSRYEEWCKTHKATDSITAMRPAIQFAKKMQPTTCIIYSLKRPTPLAAELLAAFSAEPQVIPAAATQTLPDTLKEVAIYKNVREEISQTLEKICRLEEEGVKGEDILLITPSLQSSLPLIEEISRGFFVNHSQRLTFSVSEKKSIQNMPLIRAVLAWVSAARNADENDLAQILDCSAFRFHREGITSGRFRKAVKMVGAPKNNAAWIPTLQKLEATRRHDWQKAEDEKLKTVITFILETAKRRQQSAKTLRERIAALRADLEELGWTTIPLSKTEDAARTAFLHLLERLEAAGTADECCSITDFSAILSRGCRKNAGIPYEENETAFRIGKIRSAAGIKVPHVFIIGLTSKNIPNISATLPLLTIAETKTLLPDRYRESAEDTAYYFDAAMDSASVSLHLSYAESDGANSCSPSPYLTRYAEGTPAKLLELIHSVSGNQKIAGRCIADHTNPAGVVCGIRDLQDTATRIEIEGIARKTAGEYTAVFSETEEVATFRETYREKQSISPTFLEKYVECPYAWYLTHHLHLENPKDFSAETIQIGQVMHRVLERYFTNHDCITEENADAAFKELAELTIEEMENAGIPTPSWKAKTIGYVGNEEIESTLKKLIEEEIQFSRQGFRTSPEWLEREVTAEFDDVTISGRVDRVLMKENGEFMVLDYKTGTVKTQSDAKAGKVLQIPLYTEAVRQETGGTPKIGCYLQIAPDKAEVHSLYKDGAEKVIADAKQKTTEILEAIQNGICSTTAGCSAKFCAYKHICRRGESDE